MLRRAGFSSMDLPCLRTLTQAGGAMGQAAVLEYDALMKGRGGRLFVMYGQTEATARIAYLPPERLPEKAGSVGVAVPGGALSLSETGEIVYRGPNVMMGYAQEPADLARGDERGGVLNTGDLGRIDGDGCLYLTGRLNRHAKVFGLRIALEEVERFAQDSGPAAAVAGEDRVVLYCERGGEEEHRRLRLELARNFKLHPSAFELRRIEALPLKASGKIDYERLPV
jgi:acyl-CoA synthetase (AMP-forming)/AMP-acid ligase II